MSRIVLSKGKQRDFLNRVRKETRLDWSEIASICGICERTVRDWRRERFYMKYESAQALFRKTSIPFCKPKEILPDYWSAKRIASIGGKKRYEIYGNPGTPEGRRKGGVTTQRKLRENPDLARKIGIKVRKIIKKPENSALLSEFVGILLGDGGMSNYQIVITFNSQTDKQHSIYIQNLIKRLFGIPSSIILRKWSNDKANNIVISSKNLVDFLLKKGLKVGHKINNKIDIPDWIINKREYKIACVRGLVDTDGSFYFYKHKVNGKIYNNFAICFTNYSGPLLNSVYKIFKELKFKASRTSKRIYIHREQDIRSYLNIIGSHNQKHLNKFKSYKREKHRNRNGEMPESGLSGSPRKRLC